MSRKILQLEPVLIVIDEPESNPDRITLGGVKPVGIPQVSDKGVVLGSSTIQVSRSISRKPHMVDEQKAYRHAIRRFETTVFPNMPGYRYCSGCGEWVSEKGFSPRADSRAGFASHCKECRAEHARKMYWAAKHTALPMAA